MSDATPASSLGYAIACISPSSLRSFAATSAKRAHSSAKKNRNREKPEPEYRGPHPLDIILGEKKGGEFLDPRTTTRAHNYARARAFFRGAKMQKSQKRKAAERIDDANYVRVFFLGYEKTEKSAALGASVNREIFCM